MNKIFKVIYSKTRHCYVVVSELAKSHCKTTQSHTVRSKTALTAAVLLALGTFSVASVFMPMTAEAATTKTDGSNFVGVERTDGLLDDNKYDNYGGKGANGADSITLGLRAKAGEGTITIGDRNAGASLGSVYVGQGDIAKLKIDTGGWVTSIGYNSDATGYGSIALGSNAVAKNSYAKDSKGESLDLNPNFRLNSKPDIQRASVAIGYGANADNGNIAIGSYSDASTDLRTAKTTDGKEIKSYLTDKKADSYVSVGKSNALRRISNVADGAAASDVATVGQLQELATKAGVYQAGFGIEITTDTAKKENTIKLNRNLGRDMDSTDKATLEADESKSALVLGGRVEEGQSKKGQVVEKPYGAFGQDSVVVGGANNIADKDGTAAVVVGGTTNTASAQYSTVAGGNNNDAFGNESSVFGGFDNDAFGTHATLSGGSMNKAHGEAASVFGGAMNSALGASSVAVGGLQSTVNGAFAVGIAGGSTNADHALAAGNGANVTVENGTAVGYQATTDEANTIAFGHDAGDVSGYTIEWNKLPEGQVNADGTTNDYTKAPKSVTPTTYKDAYYNRLVKVADGQDDHDVVVMEQLKNASDVGSKIKVYQTDENGNIKFDKNNNPIEDTSDSDAVKTKREAAQKASEDAWGEAIGTGKVEANNSQLVTGDTVYNAIQNQAEWKLTTNGESADKAAAIKPGTTVNFSAEKNGKNHSNVTISHNGSNVTIGLDKDIVLGDTSHSSGGSLNVYTDSSDGNNLSNHVSINGSTISVNYPKSNGDKKTTTDTRGVILGVGKEDSKPDGYIAFNNVEGSYTYLHASTDASDDKKGRLEYVGSDGNKKYIANLDDVSTAVNNAKTKYYAVNEKAPLMNLKDYKNEGNDGAKGKGSLAAGFVTHADGIASTVVGSYSGVMNKGTALGPWGLDYRGATAVSLGTVNVNSNTDTSKIYSGVANSIVGQANMTTNSNAAIIYGAGNTVTDSYRPIDPTKAWAILDNASNLTNLSKAMQDAVKESGGQVMVMGGGNEVDSAYMSQVVGVGNTVKGNQVEKTKGEWVTDTSDTAIKDYNSEKSSQYNYVDGFNNEVINGKHDYVIGANNKLSGDSYDDDQAKPIKRSNRSNIVIGDNHILTREQNTVIIGSIDTVNKQTNKPIDRQTRANDAVIIGHNANATSDTGADNAVAIGRSAKATGGNAVTIGVNTSAGENSITIGSESHAIFGSNIAIGRSAQVYGYEVTNAVALGQEANAFVADGVAIGSGSIATVKGNFVEGYDPTTGKDSTDGTATWKATKAAISIGKADGTVTRQINGVAAGTNDTDAVNVAQLKKLAGMKANVDASNIGKNLKGADDAEKTVNENAWGDAIGTGSIADGNSQLVTGNTVYAYNKPVAEAGKTLNYVSKDKTTGQNLGSLDAQVKANADNIGTNKTNITQNAGDITKLKNLSNITNEGQKVIKNLSKDAVKVTAGDRVTVTSTEDKEAGTITYKVSANNDGTVAAGDQNLVSGDTVNTAITNAITNAGTATDTKLAGKANVDASNIGANLKGSDGKTAASASDITANEDAWGTAIGTGTIASTSGQLVTGKTVYGEVRPTADGTYIKTAKTTAANLTALDTQVGRNTTNISNLQNGEGFTDKGNTYIKNLAKGSIGMENGSHTTVSHRDANGVETYKVDVNVDGKVESGNKGIVDGGAVYSAIQDVKNQTSADLANKANVDASNLTPNNVTKWQEKLGNGKVESGNTGLVTGDTVFKAVDTKANRDGSNLTDKEADSFSEKIARGEVKAGENRAVSGDAVSQAISKVTGDMNTKLDGKANTSLDNITKDGQTVIKKLSQDAVQVKAGDDHITVDAKTDETTGNKTYTISAKDGKVASGDTGLISGGTLYNEVHVDKDGSYIKSGNTVGNNLSALDTGLKNTSSLIHTNTSGDTIHIGETSKATKVDVSSTDANGNKNGRVVTGVVTDAKDANSAANVGYVNGVTAANTQQIYRDMNNAYSRLDTNINRAAAGSNALAALHPLDFDPADKASFAVGYGHYRNANAAAVGAFYQPNANTMVNMGISLGNGDPGFNAGVSFKIGKGSAYNGVSKAEMAQTIHDQATEISAIKADDAAKDKRIDALEKENQEMKKQIQEILARLNG